jgi:hypothetical protein
MYAYIIVCVLTAISLVNFEIPSAISCDSVLSCAYLHMYVLVHVCES